MEYVAAVLIVLIVGVAVAMVFGQMTKIGGPDVPAPTRAPLDFDTEFL